MIAALQVRLTATVRRLDDGDERSACKVLLKKFAVRMRSLLLASSLNKPPGPTAGQLTSSILLITAFRAGT
jgi:hypothetical protein